MASGERVWVCYGSHVCRIGLIDNRLNIGLLRELYGKGKGKGPILIGDDGFRCRDDGMCEVEMDVVRQITGEDGTSRDTPLRLSILDEKGLSILDEKEYEDDTLQDIPLRLDDEEPAAKKSKKHLKLPPELSTTEPFVGREVEIDFFSKRVARIVDTYYAGIFRDAFTFITVEGGVGVGKTRFLDQIVECTRKKVQGVTPEGQLANLYRAGAVECIRLNFKEKGAELPEVGVEAEYFISMCIGAKVKFGFNYYTIPLEQQQQVFDQCHGKLEEAMQLVSELCTTPVMVCYLFMDEFQLLTRQYGIAWVRQLADSLATYMTDGAAKEAGVIILPVAAGTIVKDIRLPGFSTFLDSRIVLASLLEEDARDYFREVPGVIYNSKGFQSLLAQCMGIPRLWSWILVGVRSGQNIRGVCGMIEHCREMAMDFMSIIVEDIYANVDEDRLKSVLRLCLMGGQVGKSEPVMNELLEGYVYWSVSGVTYTFRAPILFLHTLSRKMDWLHKPLVEFQPLRGATTLEVAGLEMLYVRLMVARSTRALQMSQLFYGCSGPDWEMNIPTQVLYASETKQFLVKKGSLRVMDDATVDLDKYPYIMPLPADGLLTKTKNGCGVVDGRLFLNNFEFWLQFKGDKELSEPALCGFCNDAFKPAIRVEGRCKVFVLFTPYAALGENAKKEFLLKQEKLKRKVILLDRYGCNRFMPGYFERT